MLFRSLVACSKVVKQSAVHLHKCLENIVDQRHNGLVPMLLAYPAERDRVTQTFVSLSLVKPVKRGEHDRHYDLVVFFNE